MLLVLLSVGVLGAPPAPEGWWPPKTVALSDMGLDEAAVSRLAAATVSLGIGRSGTLISRDGLVLSSATAVAGCVDRLRREGALSDRPFVSDPVRRGPECTELEAEIRVDVREVGPALAAARTAGAPDP